MSEGWDALEREAYREAGRRLKAALISYQLGLSGVDKTLKTIPDDPGPGWPELAEALLRAMAQGLSPTVKPNETERIQ